MPDVGESGVPLTRHVNTIITIPRTWKECENPGCELPDRRYLGVKKAHYCSPACRVAHYRQRKAEAAGT